MNCVSILSLAVFSSLIFGVTAYSDTIKCSNRSTILTISCPDGWQGQPTKSLQGGQLQFGIPKVTAFSASLTKHSGLILIDFTDVVPTQIAFVTPAPDTGRDRFYLRYWNSEKNAVGEKVLEITQPKLGSAIFPAELLDKDGKSKMDCTFN